MRARSGREGKTARESSYKEKSNTHAHPRHQRRQDGWQGGSSTFTRAPPPPGLFRLELRARAGRANPFAVFFDPTVRARCPLHPRNDAGEPESSLCFGSMPWKLSIIARGLWHQQRADWLFCPGPARALIWLFGTRVCLDMIVHCCALELLF